MENVSVTMAFLGKTAPKGLLCMENVMKKITAFAMLGGLESCAIKRLVLLIALIMVFAKKTGNAYANQALQEKAVIFSNAKTNALRMEFAKKESVSAKKAGAENFAKSE